MATLVGLEPTLYGLEGHCLIRLSYRVTYYSSLIEVAAWVAICRTLYIVAVLFTLGKPLCLLQMNNKKFNLKFLRYSG